MKKLKELKERVQEAIDNGATSVEQIHKSLAKQPVKMLKKIKLSGAANAKLQPKVVINARKTLLPVLTTAMFISSNNLQSKFLQSIGLRLVEHTEPAPRRESQCFLRPFSC